MVILFVVVWKTPFRVPWRLHQLTFQQHPPPAVLSPVCLTTATPLCEVRSRYGLIGMALVIGGVAHLYTPADHWSDFFGKMSNQVLFPFLNRIKGAEGCLFHFFFKSYLGLDMVSR